MYKIWDTSCQNTRCPGVNIEWDRKTGELVRVTKMQMEYIEEHDFYKCPSCGSENWENIEGTKITTAQARAALADEKRRQAKMRKHGGGSGPAGRKRRKPVKFEPTYRLPE